MKRNYLLKLLCAIFVTTVALFSCERATTEPDNPNKEPNEDPTEKPDPSSDPAASFAISISGDLNEQIKADVNVENYDDIYIVSVIDKETYAAEMESDTAYYAGYIIDKIQAEGSKLDRADDRYTFKGDANIALSTTWALKYSTDYLVFAFGVTPDGDVATNFSIKEYTTQDAPVSPFTIAASGTSVQDLALDVTVDAEYTNDYTVGVVKQEFFEKSLASNPKLLPGIVLAGIAQFTDGSYTTETGYVYNGSQSINLAELWDLEPETEYVIVAFGLTTYNDGSDTPSEQIIEDALTITTVNATTDSTPVITEPTVPTAAAPIITLAGAVESDGFSVQVTINDDIELYYVAVMTQFDYMFQYGNEPTPAAIGWMKDNISGLGISDLSTESGSLPVFSQNASVNLRNYYSFKVNEAYTVLAFGITPQGEVCTQAAEYTDVIPDFERVDGVTFDIQPLGELTASDCRISVTPSDKTINYLVCAYEKDDFNPNSGNYVTQDLAPDYDKAAEDWKDFVLGWYEPVGPDENPVMTNLGVANGFSVFKGDMPSIDLNYVRGAKIEAGTDYIVMAYGISAGGSVTTDITMKEISVADVQQSGLDFAFEIGTPIKMGAWGYEGSVKVTPSENGKPYFVSILPASSVDGLTDEEIFENPGVKFSVGLPGMLQTSSYEYFYSMVYENSYIIAFGYEGGMTTEIKKFLVEVPAE